MPLMQELLLVAMPANMAIPSLARLPRLDETIWARSQEVYVQGSRHSKNKRKSTHPASVGLGAKEEHLGRPTPFENPVGVSKRKWSRSLYAKAFQRKRS